jgi:hypothetical protein
MYLKCVCVCTCVRVCFVLFSKMSRPALGPTKPLVLWVTRVFIPPAREVKWPGHVADHSSASSAEDKSEWSFTSSPPVCLSGIHGNNLITYVTCFLPRLYVRTPDP